MSRDREMYDSSALVRQHQKHIQDLEPDVRHGEEVDRHHALQVIVEERPPGLRWRLSSANHVLAHAGFTDIDAELEQFAVNAWSPPEWIFTAHRTNQFANLLWHRRPSRFAVANLPGPEESKALAMPAQDGGGVQDRQHGLPVVPHDTEPRPQESIRRPGSVFGA